MNNKLLIIPTVILSSTLLLTGCSFGKQDPNATGTSSPSSSSSASPSGESNDIDTSNPDYVAPPSDLKADYQGYYYAPATVDPNAWQMYKNMGATTYKEDPSVRSTTQKDWDAARKDDKAAADQFAKMFGEISSDVEQSALNVSAYLEANKDASVDELTSNKELVINRYSNLGTTVVEQDSSTGFYFVIFKLNDKDIPTHGILVPQEGITPDFNQPPAQ